MNVGLLKRSEHSAEETKGGRNETGQNRERAERPLYKSKHRSTAASNKRLRVHYSAIISSTSLR